MTMDSNAEWSWFRVRGSKTVANEMKVCVVASQKTHVSTHTHKRIHTHTHIHMYMYTFHQVVALCWCLTMKEDSHVLYVLRQ